MNKHKVVWILALALTLLVSAMRLDSVALAQSPPVQEVTWRYLKTQTVVPGRAWFDRAGYHIRGRVDVGRIFGDIQGSARVEYNADFPYNAVNGLPFLPGDGTAYGSMVISRDNISPPSHTIYDWRGTWTYSIRGGKVVSGRLVALNGQNTQRMRIDKVYQDSLGFLVHRGFIEWLYCEGMPCR